MKNSGLFIMSSHLGVNNHQDTTKNNDKTSQNSNLKPLRLDTDYLSREILEAQNEPLKSEQSCSNKSNWKPIPLRLTNWSRELLEAENEPLKPLPLTILEESDEYVLNNEVQSAKDVPVEKVVQNNNLDLRISSLETPSKIVSSTDTASDVDLQRLFATPLVVKSEGNRFTTPKAPVSFSTTQSSTNKPKIQYSIDIKSLLKTPTNNSILNKPSSESSLHSLKKHNTPVYNNVTNKTISSVQKVNSTSKRILEEHNKEIPNVKTVNSTTKVLEDNKENTVSKGLRFSVDDFKKIVVKGVPYIVLNQLGRGGSSVVYHCYNPSMKCERAIKKVDLNRDTTNVGYINEVKMLEKLQKCDRIIMMYDYEIIKSENTLLVVLERGGQDLSKILKDLCMGDKRLPMHMLIFYWLEMLHAVRQIHENGIIHSDLKPSNFLRAEGGLKLIDFGIASCISDDMTSVMRDVMIGSFDYISPEALTNQSSHSSTFQKPTFKVTYKSDVWSLGCILYQLVYRRAPFHSIGGQVWNKLAEIVNPHHKIQYPPVNGVPLKIINTIQNCLKYNQKDRPSILELIQEYDHFYQ